MPVHSRTLEVAHIRKKKKMLAVGGSRPTKVGAGRDPTRAGSEARHNTIRDGMPPHAEKAYSGLIVMATTVVVARVKMGVDGAISRCRRGPRLSTTKKALWEKTKAKARRETTRPTCEQMVDESWSRKQLRQGMSRTKATKEESLGSLRRRWMGNRQRLSWKQGRSALEP